ncbi:hypothetical protein P168DRAFT_287330 [Aspergillus campestris IBT 28561]|uniref:Translation initiation factor 5A C-terminal domain-containing protein n=1 Tax=Aspergillus campestris (strain IBT 28561) TaxID=1392248 RepID=A0A2I1DHC4_ASPC2|nr:uncharacterized protein P168DRAFT_287330 [Aspergillus campestris IBT 28561]PKY09270.1 hypothetical protein P168DRAFT_287330 [Aspergillus campestris IBT 28561]
MTDDLIYSFHTKECSELRKNDFVFVNGRPCQISSIRATSLQEGCQKVLIEGDDIFSGDRRVQEFLSTDIMDIPVVTATKFHLISIRGQTLCLTSSDGSEKNDVPLPKSALGMRILAAEKSREECVIFVQSVMGEEAAVDMEIL